MEKKMSRILLSIIGSLCAILIVVPSASAIMHGYDVSGYQSPDISTAAPSDFVVVKATQGLSWSNRNYAAQVAGADRAGKATGMYHFANGGNAVAEADTFVNAVSDRVGKSVLALDWEQCLAYGRYGCFVTNPNWGNPAWIQTWVTRVHDRTAVWPIVYIQRSAVWQVNAWVRARCMLWVAQYASTAATGYQSNPWNAGASGEGMTQYTSSGYVGGRGPLDLDIFFGDRTAWSKIACGERRGCSVGTVGVIREPSTSTSPSTPSTRSVLVMAGDTVSAIAQRTGLQPVTAWSVPSGNINLIYPGQIITYHGTSSYYGSTTHIVRSGESLWSIYGAGWQAAAQRNGLSYPYVIYPGQRLM